MSERRASFLAGFLLAWNVAFFVGWLLTAR